MWLSPDRAYVLGAVGTLLILVEFVQPGRVLPGVSGAVLVTLSAYQLSQYAATRAGCFWLLAAALFFAVEAIGNVPFLAGLLGIAAAGFGGLMLLRGSTVIEPVVSWGAACVVGATVLVLSLSARRARRNKRVDL